MDPIYIENGPKGVACGDEDGSMDESFPEFNTARPPSEESPALKGSPSASMVAHAYHGAAT